MFPSDNPKLGEMFLDALRLKYIRKTAEEIMLDGNPNLPPLVRENPELQKQAIDGIVEFVMDGLGLAEIADI